jgi:twitching motility protein PilT
MRMTVPERHMKVASSPAAGAAPVAFDDWLRELVAGRGSDLHLKVGSPPMIREAEGLRRLEREPLTPDQLEDLAEAIVPERRKPVFEEFGEVDFAHSLPGVGRFRANVFRQRGSVSMVFRKLRLGGPTFEEIGLADVVRQLAEERRGLILVTGPTGSGKTTSLAAMIEHINGTRPVHIVTIEDPIEVIYTDKVAAINQREIGQDSTGFLKALRAALRQDPDVILIGEMRDAETVQAALQAAETGHLVLSTLHTTNATETVNRLVDFFPAGQQQQIRSTLAGALRGIVCQRLVPTVGGGRLPCLEVLINTGRIAERIVDASKTSEIEEVVADSQYYGMRTFDQSLLTLVSSGDVSVEQAMEAASNPHDFDLMLKHTQVRSTHTVSEGRPPLSFAEAIRPLFREEDRVAMSWSYDLWDAASVQANASTILDQLERGAIPVGGDPWPDEQIELFREWMRDKKP